jgi:hypothetical protein
MFGETIQVSLSIIMTCPLFVKSNRKEKGLKKFKKCSNKPRGADKCRTPETNENGTRFPGAVFSS